MKKKQFFYAFFFLFTFFIIFPFNKKKKTLHNRFAFNRNGLEIVNITLK
jgi:hypothetical protein